MGRAQMQVHNVELPDCFINRFTSSGEFLVRLRLHRFSLDAAIGYELCAILHPPIMTGTCMA